MPPPGAPEGGPPGMSVGMSVGYRQRTEVWTRVRARDTDVELSIRDAGPGMPPDVMGRVFDRFYRVDPGRTRAHGGTGLGLSIVKSLTEAHGGTVSCTSTVAGGSTFVLTLPLATRGRVAGRHRWS